MDMNDLPMMSPAELLSTREYLGLSTKWISEHLVMDERRITRMEAGEAEVPPNLVAFLDDLYLETKEAVERLIATNRRKAKSSDEPVTIYTYRTDHAYLAAGGKYPSRWHRHICARVAEAVPNMVIAYTSPEKIVGVNIGERITGTVTNITDFGVFVQLRPDLDGLIHITQIDPGKRILSVGNIQQYVRRGDTVEVEVLNIDGRGRVTLKLINDDDE